MATLTNFIIACDEEGCEEQIQSKLSLARARAVAERRDWFMGDRDLCPSHANQQGGPEDGDD